MAYIGSAYLNVTPKFPGLSAAVKKELGGVDTTPVGRQWGSGLGNGMVSQGALFGTFSALANRAIDSVSEHVGAAVQRFDTLNQYPRTMELLGYSAEDAEASITKMSDRLSSLPTTLDSMTSTVQGIVAITGDLDQATDAGLALNDMLVASGANQQLVTAAMEQFRQMLAKGRPEMEDWRALTSAAPGQMAQLAQAMLGPTANANDLYYALGGGGKDPTITMDQLLDAMIRLDNEGGDGITSFRQQAETAAGGIQTAMANMSNAVTKGIAGLMEEVGQDRISGVLNDVKSGINDAFGIAREVIGEVVPVAEDLYEAIRPVAPEILTFAGAFGVLNAAGGGVADVVKGIAGNVKKLTPEMDLLTRANTVLGTSFDPVSLGIAAVSAALSVGITAWADYTEKQENFAEATTGLNDAVADTMALDEYAGAVANVGSESEFSAMSVDELAESTSKHVEAMRRNNEEAEATIAELSNAQAVLNEYAGQTDLSAEAQGRLQWALSLVNDEFGLSITQADVAADSYRNADGEVVNLRDSINELIEAKKEEARVSAITANLTEAYQAQSDAAKTLAQAQHDYNEEVQRYLDQGMTQEEAETAARAYTEEGRALESAEEQYRSATDAVSDLEEELGNAATASSEAATEMDAWASKTGPLFEQQLAVAGTSLSMLKDDLSQLGASTEDLSTLSEDQLTQLAQAYDGTAASVVDLLDEWGVSMDETAAAAARMSADYRAALDEIGASGALEQVGVDLDSLSQRLAAAGVETSTLADIGSANLTRLAESCRGNTELMVWAIQNYNSVPLVNKDGTVTVNDAELVTANGEVVVWNGTTLVYKSTGAAVEDQDLIDAQGRVYTWNGTELESKSATATIDFSSLATAVSLKSQWNSGGLNNYSASAVATVQHRYIAMNQAEGGINIRGGVRPVFHAEGFIADRPGDGVVLEHRVGEAGAEAVIPLTNRRYVYPFADVVAEGVERRLGGQSPTVVNVTNNFNSPVETPYKTARAIKRAVTRGLAGARG